MITKISSSRILTPEGLASGNLYVEGDQILQITQKTLPCDRELDYGEKLLVPGFVDLHVHGGMGYDFSTATGEQSEKIVQMHLQHGTTTMLPTITSGSFADVWGALERLEKCSAPSVVGAHLEGPYFSPKQCGAQATAHLTDPVEEDYKALVSRFGSLIRRWSYAPERDIDGTFASYLTRNGIVSSMGHTDAVYADCVRAMENGCALVTHLYSCTSTVTRQAGFRRLGVIETAYLHDTLNVELIADGCHLPKELVQMIYKIKGSDRVCLVTDAIAAAGTEEAQGTVGDVAYIVEDGVAKLPDRSAFAGSIATTDRLLAFCVKEAKIPLQEAVKMLTETPARILGLPCGKLVAGAPADLVVLNDALEVCAVFSKGSLVK